jgi:cytochrome c-type biogenesis protein CcmH/NrfF
LAQSFHRVLFMVINICPGTDPCGYSRDNGHQVNAIANSCTPVCENIPLDVCPTQACAQWRELIREKLAVGWSEKEIKNYFVEQYGERVLGTPPVKGINWLVYLIPPLAMLAGGFIVYKALRTWKPTESQGDTGIAPASKSETNLTEAGKLAEKNSEQPSEAYVKRLKKSYVKRMSMTENSSEITPEETSAKKRTSWGRILAWVGLFTLLGLVAISLVRGQQGPVAIGKPAPDFTLTTFDGNTIKLSELKGKVVVLNFWASWCKPCEQEAADLEGWRYCSRGDVVHWDCLTDTEPASKVYMGKV